MTRWITIYFQGDYYKNHLVHIFKGYIVPIIEEFGGTNGKCATYLDMTDAEYKFESEKQAKNAVSKIKTILKMLSKTILPNKVSVQVMPSYYETSGSRNIVRPDYHAEDISMIKIIKGFEKLKLEKKYKDRKSPPLPASYYCGKRINGSDGNMYESVVLYPGKTKPLVLPVCQWRKV